MLLGLENFHILTADSLIIGQRLKCNPAKCKRKCFVKTPRDLGSRKEIHKLFMLTVVESDECAV